MLFVAPSRIGATIFEKKNGDEKWIVYNNTNGKRSRRTPSSAPKATSKAGLNPKKILLSI